MKKLLYLFVALIACTIALVVFGKDTSFVVFGGKSGVVAKVKREQNRTLAEAQKLLDVYAENVKNALAGYNKVNNLVESTKERKAEADSTCEDCRKKLQFIREHIEANEPIVDTAGVQLTSQEIDVEVDRYGVLLEAAMDASKAYTQELAELEQTGKTFYDWAVTGPVRLEALRTKMSNTRKIFDSQLQRFELLSQNEIVDVKKAFKDAIATIDSANIDIFGSKRGKATEETINFNFEKLSISETSLKKINSMLGEASCACADHKTSLK